MEHYKAVNTELIGKVQEMKLAIGVYQKEIVELRKQFMEEHNLRVELQHKFLNIVTRNFQDTLFQIDPQVDISELFSRLNVNGTQERNTLDRNGTKRLSDPQRDCVERQSSADALLKELRRSNSLQQYVNVITRSPTKRRSSSRGSYMMENVPTELSEISQTSNELESCESDYENDQVENDAMGKASSFATHKPQTEHSAKENEANNDEEYSQQLDVILEHTVEEEDITEESNSSLEITQNDNTNNHTVKHPPDIVWTLRDVTNQKGFQSQDKSQKSLTSFYSSPPNLSCKLGSNRVQKRRGKARYIRHNDSIETPRTAPSFNGGCSDSTDDSRKESYYSFNSLAMQDITIENFRNAPSSTPCQQQQTQLQLTLRHSTLHAQTLKNSVVQVTNDVINMTNAAVIAKECTYVNDKHSSWSIDNTNCSMTTSNNSKTRPRRKCAPKNLAEPNLINKMRDTSKTRKKRSKT